ncbi:MAG: hypothetical protein HY594_00680 [Candidatus Omnitrophica bacterium]|nr:hypothetical protein [Candidatus Omnitrophota bacterium]
MARFRRRFLTVCIVALAVSLAWGVRGQHGHERGAAFVGAMAGLCIAALTGKERWVWAAVWCSLGFSVGGAISYGWFIGRASDGSVAAMIAVLAVGALWGSFGAGGLGWGLRSSSSSERWIVVIATLLTWWWMDGPLSKTLEISGFGPRRTLLIVLGLLWAGLAFYLLVIRRDRVTGIMMFWGALGWGAGFPIGMTWLSAGPSLKLEGWPMDWWKCMEHTIGAVGGACLAWGALRCSAAAEGKLKLRQKWVSLGWFFVVIPTWLWANNLSFWYAEQRVISLSVVILAIFAIVIAVLLFVSSWHTVSTATPPLMARPWNGKFLRMICIVFAWMGVLTATLKTVPLHGWGSTQTFFFLAAGILTAALLAWRDE